MDVGHLHVAADRDEAWLVESGWLIVKSNRLVGAIAEGVRCREGDEIGAGDERHEAAFVGAVVADADVDIGRTT
jgi:hypothetical protein